ncbi:hypothetical protein BH23GEM4_BH23GEM4_08020 [soil metagenome]
MTYSVFGGCLQAEISFDHLLPPSERATPDWTLHEVERLPPLGDATLVGELTLEASATLRLLRTNEGYRVEYSDSGTFEVRHKGSLIQWRRGTDPDSAATEELARFDLLGRVLPLSLYQNGILPLHGSAVALAARDAVAFLAPKFHGKSTLAQALLARGARLITDDVVAVRFDAPPVLLPGVAHLRLWNDSLGGLGVAAEATTQRGAKHILGPRADRALQREAAPLAAVYLLVPFSGDGDDGAVQRQQLEPSPAALSLVRHSRLGELFSGVEAAELFQAAVRLAREVPVYALRMVRDFDRLPEVVDQLLEWHVVNPATRAVG